MTRADLIREIGDPMKVSHAIRMLIHIGVVREERPNSNRYLVGGDMFRRWFLENYPATPKLLPPRPASAGTSAHIA